MWPCPGLRNTLSSASRSTEYARSPVKPAGRGSISAFIFAGWSGRPSSSRLDAYRCRALGAGIQQRTASSKTHGAASASPAAEGCLEGGTTDSEIRKHWEHCKYLLQLARELY